MEKAELGIYIHIPFCVKKCYYCDFISFTNQNENIETYIKAVLKELDEYDLNKYNVTTIYIGGGTPSAISSIYIVNILEKIKEKLENNNTEWKDIEITIEVNPGTVIKEKLQDYKSVGVNRLSIGLQTTNDNLLKIIGRIHTYKEFLETYKQAEEVGFKNINVDLMIGLPSQTIQDLKDSLNKVINLEPKHISTYSLILEENTVLEKLVESGKLILPDEDMERQMYWYVKNTLELNGYNHYEISNFAKEGFESKHNLNCWEQKQYIGLGLAASSYINNERYSNVSDMKKYLNGSGKIIEEKQSIEDAEKEYMLLGLRKINGVNISKFKEKFACNPLFLFREELNKLVMDKLIAVDTNNIKLTNKGLDFANLVWEEFVDE